jgi:hypothetical protein
MQIKIVNDEACPGCGAYWGNPDESLDFPNRPKVDNDFKCYNPECEVGFYSDGEIVEYVPSPDEMERIKREVEEDLQHQLANGGMRVVTHNADGTVTEELMTDKGIEKI